MARYLVTGGCGFIGAHLTEALLDKGHQVVIADNLTNGDAPNFICFIVRGLWR